MAMMRVLIVDDEPLARLRLRTLLTDMTDMQIVGEAGDGEEAITMIEALRPDVAFLDVQMPGMNGFEVITAIGVENMPLVVFVTAYDQFAVRAFEMEALDYLLKPFDDRRFNRVVERMRAQEFRRPQSERLHNALPPPKRLVARTRGRIQMIPFSDIDWIGAAGDYVEVHAGQRTYLVDDAIVHLSDRLADSEFVRIHRSTVVRIDRIAEIRPAGHGDAVIHLITGQMLRASRNYRDRLALLAARFSGSTKP